MMMNGWMDGWDDLCSAFSILTVYPHPPLCFALLCSATLINHVCETRCAKYATQRQTDLFNEFRNLVQSLINKVYVYWGSTVGKWKMRVA